AETKHRNSENNKFEALLPMHRNASLAGTAAFSSEIFIEVVENGASPFQSRQIVFVSHGDTGYQLLDARCLLAAKLPILQIDVMDNLCDSADGGLVNSRAFHQHLQGATVTLMRKLRLEHIKA